MTFYSDPAKSVQAASVLLRAHPGRRMGCLRLLKLLYLADRESLKLTGRPIVGDRPIAMNHGPVHGGVLELIDGIHPSEQAWSAYISKTGYALELLNDPGVLQLSKQDIVILDSVAQRHGNDSDWDLAELTRTFGEWRKSYVDGALNAIPVEDILDGIGFSPEDRAAILEDLNESREDDALVSPPPPSALVA